MFSRFVVSQVKHNSYFLVGVVLGLWVSLVAVPFDEEPVSAACGVTEPLISDEYEPQREERPLGPAGPAAGRSVQRPRYYSTELGMRGSLLSGVLSSEEALESRVAALNRTAARLQPALRIFMAASAPRTAPAPANVVGFTDTREMLKPFHALKYLADNYLDEYDFFFLVSDASFVNARRLQELVSKLSVSQDVYMGIVADGDSHYCSLEGGMILSNSVLRLVHGELDWCVRNSYSPHHHENIGRCVLHAAHLHCSDALQGEQYQSVRVTDEAAALTPALVDAVTAYPLTEPGEFYRLHAYVSRVYLERDNVERVNLRSALVRLSSRHPRGYRNSTWPAGLRSEPGFGPTPPENRFDHLRWTLFNESHAFMPDDHRTVGTHTGPFKVAVQAVLRTARAWCINRWPEAAAVSLVEGAWRWEPPTALRYRLLLSLSPAPGVTPGAAPRLRSVEIVRALGAARLVPAPYVTEASRVTLLLPVPARQVPELAAFMRRYLAVCLQQDRNTALTVIIVGANGPNDTSIVTARDTITSVLGDKQRNAHIDVLSAPDTAVPLGPGWEEAVQRAGVEAALPKFARDALMLLMPVYADFNQDFLNRVRMNTIMGCQWYLAGAFARYSQYSHPRLVASDGRHTHRTGRFNMRRRLTASFYRRDLDKAMSEWKGPSDASIASMLGASSLRCLHGPEPGLVLSARSPPCRTISGQPDQQCLNDYRNAMSEWKGPSDASIASMLGASSLRCLHGPEPGLVLSARSPPCRTISGQPEQRCLNDYRNGDFSLLDLGDKHSLARLLLEDQAASAA